jgi:uncharacterized membrane protein
LTELEVGEDGGVVAYGTADDHTGAFAVGILDHEKHGSWSVPVAALP